MAEALVVRNLSRRFGGLRAVQDLSFSVNEGETLALIGPNGAGKTTSFNLITGYHRPNAGSVVGLRPRAGRLAAARHLCARPGPHISGCQTVRQDDGAGQRDDRRIPARQDA